MMTIFMFALLVCGVFGDDVLVMEGDSVTLHTKFTDTQRDEILWKFGPEGSSKLLVNIDGSTPNIKDIEGFKDRLQILNIQSGDLIIKNIRKKHTGLYKAVIEGDAGTFEKKFNVIVYDAPDVLDAGTDEVKSVSVTVGGSVTLNTDVNLQKDNLIVWRFGHKGALIAKDDVEDSKTPEYPDERFKGRLQVNDQTGDLIIKDLTYTDSGVYKLKISNNKEIIHKTFSLSVRGVVTDESVSVMEGESVTLHTDITDIQRDEMLWWFGPEGSSSLLVQIVGSKPDITKDVRFKDRLQISDILSGNLTIKNMRKNHAGFYKAVIEGAPGKFQKIFNVIVYDAPRVLEAGTDEVKSVSVTVGDSVTLNTDVNLQRDALILWRFGHEGALIAIDDVDDNKTPEYPDERFKGRLQVNDQTGDLTIRDLTYTDSGVYKLKISSNKEIIHKTFSLSVRGGGLSAVYIALMCILAIAALVGVLAAVWYHRKSSHMKVKKEVPEGKNVTLRWARHALQPGAQIEWKFNGRVITPGEITENTGITENNSDDQRFEGRLKCDPYYGHLIIKNVSKKDTGLYEGKITNKTETIHSRFYVKVIDDFMSVPVGKNLTLHGADSELQTGAQIEWKFNKAIVTGKKTEDKNIKEINVVDQQLKDRLIWDPYYGHLIIKNVSSKDSGLYEGKITNNNETLHFKVHVEVFANIPVGLMM